MLCQHITKLCFIDFVNRAKRAVSQDTEVFQGESLGKTPDGWVVWLPLDAFKMLYLTEVSHWSVLIHCAELNGILAFHLLLQSRSDHLQGAVLISQWPQPTRSRLQVHELGQSSRHVELPQGSVKVACNDGPLPHPEPVLYTWPPPAFREQLLASTWLRPRLESSWPRSCPSSCPASTVTSLTPTWAFGRPWPASGMPWWLTRPWYDLSPCGTWITWSTCIDISTKYDPSTLYPLLWDKNYTSIIMNNFGLESRFTRCYLCDTANTRKQRIL